MLCVPLRHPTRLALLAGCALALISSQAQAQKRAVVLGFQGPGAERPQRQLISALESGGRVTLVGAGELFTVASELGIDATRIAKDPTLLSQAASGAQVDAVVTGRVFKAGRAKQLTLTVHDGGTGNQLRQLTVKLQRGGIARGELPRIATRVAVAIDGGQWMGPLPPAVPGLPLGDPGRSADPDPGLLVAPVPPPPTSLPPAALPPTELPPLDAPPDSTDDLLPDHDAGRGSWDEPLDRADDWRGADPAPLDDDDGRFERGPSGTPGGGHRAGVSLLAGMALLGRSFALEGVRLADGRPGNVNYESGFYPGLWVDAEVFPLALAGRRDWLAGFGLVATFDLGFLKSQIEEQITKQGQSEAVKRTEDTQQYQAAGGLAYRIHPFAMGGGEAALTFELGFWRAHFALAEGTPGYRSNQTNGLRPGVQARLPLFTSGPLAMALDLRGAVLYGSTSLNAKDRYPSSDALGYEARAGLGLDYGGVFTAHAAYLFQSCQTDFAAIGDEPTATGTDRYSGLLVLLGYRN